MGTTKAFHPLFIKNQLLSSTQLNQLFNYLEQQDRDSRVKLTGTGKVCGLNWEKSASGDKITITEGYGITSDGYLISLAKGDYTHYRKYVDPDVADPHAKNNEYWQEKGGANGEPQGQIDLYELLETNDDVAEQEDYITLNNDVLSGRILVLYLEKKSVDLASCLVTDCDSKGRNIKLTVRVLLVPKKYLDTVDSCPSPPSMLRVSRLHFIRKKLFEVKSANDINHAYQEIIASLETELTNKITDAFKRYGVFLGLGQDTSWLNLSSFFSVDADQVNQYHYDALKDLICAYNEMVSAACELITDCSLEQDFPRHLMLGAMGESEIEGESGTEGESETENYCNEFRSSPVKNVMHGDLLRVRKLFLRLRQMVEALPAALDAIKADEEGKDNEIRMTPSHTERYRLGQRAIPWYFDNDALRANWQPKLCCTTDRLWHHQDPDVMSPTYLDEDYNLASLIRIEGHLGMKCDKAIEEIKKLRNEHNAEFCLLHLYLNDIKTEEDNKFKNVKDAQDRVLNAQSEFRQILRELIGNLNQTGEPNTDEWMLRWENCHREIMELEKAVLGNNQSWAELRCQYQPVCDVSHLSADYLVIRAELLAMLSHLKQLVDRIPEPQASLLYLPGSELLFCQAVYALTLREAIEVLKGYFPKDICDFNYKLFLCKYKELINNLIELLLVSEQLNDEQSPATRQVNSSLPQLELPGIDHGFGFLTVLRSAIHARLAPLYYRYQKIREITFKDFASRVNGMEHLAGVEKGGAFILVCDEDKNVVADFSLAACPACCCTVDDKELCLPPVAVPDYIAVDLNTMDQEEVVTPLIDVLKSDYGANNDNPKLTVQLEAKESELGGIISREGKNGPFRVSYKDKLLVPGTVDRFSYTLVEKSTNCGALDDEGHVLIFFYVPKIGVIKGSVLLRHEPVVGATVTLKEINGTTETKETSNVDGLFEFQKLRFGTYTLSASIGRESAEMKVTVDEKTPSVEVDLQLRE